jgi:hypothetical protein
MSSSSGDSTVSKIGLESRENGCEGCRDTCDSLSLDLFFCNVCKCTLCSDCWSAQVPHKKQRLAPGEIPHEKTDPWVAKQVGTVFSPPLDEVAYQEMYLDDEDTAWFGA